MNVNICAPLYVYFEVCSLHFNHPYTGTLPRAEARAFSLDGHFPTLTRRVGQYGRTEQRIKVFAALGNGCYYRGPALASLPLLVLPPPQWSSQLSAQHARCKRRRRMGTGSEDSGREGEPILVVPLHAQSHTTRKNSST